MKNKKDRTIADMLGWEKVIDGCDWDREFPEIKTFKECLKKHLTHFTKRELQDLKKVKPKQKWFITSKNGVCYQIYFDATYKIIDFEQVPVLYNSGERLYDTDELPFKRDANFQDIAIELIIERMRAKESDHDTNGTLSINYLNNCVQVVIGFDDYFIVSVRKPTALEAKFEAIYRYAKSLTQI